MGLRFQRRIKVLPGVRIELSKSGVGFSVGGRGAHFGIDSRGRRYTSVGLPGEGASWREYEHEPAARRCDLPRTWSRAYTPRAAVIVALAVAAVVLLLSLSR